MRELNPIPVGSYVALRKSSVFFGRHPKTNPDDTVRGKVVGVDDDSLIPYQVEWEGGGRNIYNRSDLKYWKGPPKRKEPINLEASIEKARNTVTKGKRTAHYAFVYNDGRVAENTNTACHHQVFTASGKNIHAIVTLIRRHEHTKQEDVCKRYMEWLHERSPWSQAFVGSFEKAWDSWFAVVTSDCPGNIMQGALIASRQTQENMDRVKTWDYLVQRGMPENAAFFFASCFYEDGGKGRISYKWGGHYPIDVTDMNERGIEAFIKGQPLYTTPKYCRGGVANGVHGAFEGRGESTYKVVVGLVEKAKKTISDKPVRNPFTKALPKRDSNLFSMVSLISVYLERGLS